MDLRAGVALISEFAISQTCYFGLFREALQCSLPEDIIGGTWMKAPTLSAKNLALVVATMSIIAAVAPGKVAFALDATKWRRLTDALTNRSGETVERLALFPPYAMARLQAHCYRGTGRELDIFLLNPDSSALKLMQKNELRVLDSRGGIQKVYPVYVGDNEIRIILIKPDGTKNPSSNAYFRDVGVPKAIEVSVASGRDLVVKTEADAVLVEQYANCK